VGVVVGRSVFFHEYLLNTVGVPVEYVPRVMCPVIAVHIALTSGIGMRYVDSIVIFVQNKGRYILITVPCEFNNESEHDNKAA